MTVNLRVFFYRALDTLLIASMKNHASITMSIVYIHRCLTFDVFPHTTEHLCTAVLDDFISAWIGLFHEATRTYSYERPLQVSLCFIYSTTLMVVSMVNNNTQNAAVAPRPSTTHPLVWAEQHKHTSVYNLPVPGLPP